MLAIRETFPSLALSLIPLRQSQRPTKQGRERGLWLLSAGTHEGVAFAEYARTVHAFDWSGFYAAYDGGAFFRWLREELQTYADIVLVDSRTGVTEMSGVCTRDLADLVISFCATNDANLSGVLRMTRWFLEPGLTKLRGGRRLRAVIVPSRVDGKSETLELGRFRTQFLDEVAALRQLDGEIDAAAWWDLQIGYYSFYSFQERIVIGQSAESEYLQRDLWRLATYVARRLVAVADPQHLLSRPLEAALRTLLEESGIGPDAQAEAAFDHISASDHERALSILARFVHVIPSADGWTPTAIDVQIKSFDQEHQAWLDRMETLGLVARSLLDSGEPVARLARPAFATAGPA